MATREHDPVVKRQLPLVAKIIHDETWLEGERRSQPVRPDDPVVKENVCRIILRVGAEWRARFSEPTSRQESSLT